MKTKIFFLCLVVALLVHGAATVVETEVELPTYAFSDPDPVPATALVRYPYFFFDGSTAKAEPKKWKAVVLENEKIKVTLLPEIGGKVWGAEDKATGRAFIYYNHAVKFRNIALRGPWCSGGIEFNFGVIGHSPCTATPVDWCVRTNADGSASCFVGTTEWICRTTWQVEVNLPADADHFTTRTTWFNGANFSNPYYQWMTAAYSARGNPSLEFPGKAYIGHGGDSHAWPVDPEGHDLSVYGENAFGGPKSEHVVNGDNGVFGIWWGGEGTNGFGSVHLNHPTQKYGRKVWLWALSRDGGIWEDLLTDKDGQYVELQSGRCFNQPRNTYKTPFKHPTFAPGATDTFEEQWGVVRDRAFFDRAWNETNYVERPQFMPGDFDWDTAYGRYLMGEQHLRQKEDREGEACLKKALEKEPHFAPALDLLASLAVRRGRYAEAHVYAARALALNTYDPEANYAEGLAFFAEGRLQAAKERLGLAAYAPQFRTAAFARVAKAELREGNWYTANEMASKALLANALNLDAWLVRLVAMRKSGDAETARAGACEILARVPLFHGARAELARVEPGAAPWADAVRCELPQETFLELGTWYEEAGLDEEAEECFRLAAAHTAVGAIRLAGLLNRTGRVEAAAKILDEAAKKSVAFALPFRRETIPAALWAVRAHPSWKFKYLAAVALAANAWDAEADDLLAACGEEPDDEVFYLYRASRRTGEEALFDLRRAAKMGTSWRTGVALFRHFKGLEKWEQALREIEPFAKRFPDVNLVKLAYGEALARSGRFQAAVDYLKGVTILPSEGGNSATAAWVWAWRGLAEEALARKDEKAARAAVAQALSFPENLGRGKPYDLDFDNPLFTGWSDALRRLR